jgi:nucleotide-binding universal stress UspA family protein
MFQRLLLGMDDAPSGQVGLSFASALARQYSASVHVLHINVMLVGGRGFTSRTPEEARRFVAAAVDELRANEVEATGDVAVATCFGIADRIVQVAEQWSADTIVLGSQRRRWMPRLRGNAIREGVISLSTLPVLTAPAPLSVQGRVQPPLPSSGSPAQPISRRT